MEGVAMATSLRAWETTVCYKWGCRPASIVVDTPSVLHGV